MKAAAQPKRIQILKILADRSYSWRNIARLLGENGKSGLYTYHLKTLLREGLITYDKKLKEYHITGLGRKILETLSDKVFEYG